MPVPDSPRRRHHVVPRLHLKGFASEAGRLEQVDVTSGHRRHVSITDAAVIRDFYTVTLPDGRRSDAWERWLSDIENEVAPALTRAATMPTFSLSEADRTRLARWMAVQYLRGPDSRRQMQEMRAVMLRMQVGIGGIAYLHHVMSEALGRSLAMVEVAPIWDDLTSDEGPTVVVDGEDHLRHLARIFDEAVAHIMGRSWARVRFERHKLMLSDTPVCLVRGDTPAWRGVGLMTAPVITIPLDQQTLLWLDIADADGPADDRELPASSKLARLQNLSTALSAERFIYFDPSGDPIPPGAVPRPRLPRVEAGDSTGFVNRDRPLHDVLTQIADSLGHRNNGLIADYDWPIPGYVPPRKR